MDDIKKFPNFSKIKTNFPQFNLPEPDEDFDILNKIDKVFYAKKNITLEEIYQNTTYVEYRKNCSDNNSRL
jgi:hypothetical protein